MRIASAVRVVDAVRRMGPFIAAIGVGSRIEIVRIGAQLAAVVALACTGCQRHDGCSGDWGHTDRLPALKPSLPSRTPQETVNISWHGLLVTK